MSVPDARRCRAAFLVLLKRAMTLHFAYGSNMSRRGMRARCPHARAIGTITLPGWRFIIGRDGFASLVRQPGGCVHGVLWRLSTRDVAAINAYESVQSGLYVRRRLPVRLELGSCPVWCRAGASVCKIVCNRAGLYRTPARHRCPAPRLCPSGGRSRSRLEIAAGLHPFARTLGAVALARCAGKRHRRVR